MMSGRYSDAQVIAIQKQAGGGVPVSELCREHGMSSASLYKWRAKFGGKQARLGLWPVLFASAQRSGLWLEPKTGLPDLLRNTRPWHKTDPIVNCVVHATCSPSIARKTSSMPRNAPVCRYSIALSAALWASMLEPATQSVTTRQK